LGGNSHEGRKKFGELRKHGWAGKSPAMVGVGMEKPALGEGKPWKLEKPGV